MVKSGYQKVPAALKIADSFINNNCRSEDPDYSWKFAKKYRNTIEGSPHGSLHQSVDCSPS